MWVGSLVGKGIVNVYVCTIKQVQVNYGAERCGMVRSGAISGGAVCHII